MPSPRKSAWSRPGGAAPSAPSNAFPDLAAALRTPQTRRTRNARTWADEPSAFNPYPSRVDEINARATHWRRAGRTARPVVQRHDGDEDDGNDDSFLELRRAPASSAPSTLRGMASIVVRDHSQRDGGGMGVWASMYHTAEPETSAASRVVGRALRAVAHAPQDGARSLPTEATDVRLVPRERPPPADIDALRATLPDSALPLPLAPGEDVAAQVDAIAAWCAHPWGWHTVTATPGALDALWTACHAAEPAATREVLRSRVAEALVQCAALLDTLTLPVPTAPLALGALCMGAVAGRACVDAWAPHLGAEARPVLVDCDAPTLARLVDGLTASLSWHVSAHWARAAPLPPALVPALVAAWQANGVRSVPLSPERFYVTATGLPAALQEYTQWLRGAATLCDTPFLLTLAAKAQCIAWEARGAMRTASHAAWAARAHEAPQSESAALGAWHVSVLRSSLVADSLDALEMAPPGALHRPLQVTFRDEMAQDAGGLRKEWLQLLCEELQRDGVWEDLGESEPRMRGLLYLTPGHHAPATLARLELLGTALGLSLFHQMTVPLRFPRALYTMLLALAQGDAAPCTLATLTHLQPALAHGLAQLLACGAHEVEAWHLTWHIHTPHGAYDLVPGGHARSVTAADRHAYVARLCAWRLLDSVREPLAALVRGFAAVVAPATPRSPLALLADHELETLLCGRAEHGLDIEALRAHAEHVGFPDRASPASREVYDNLEAFWAAWAHLAPDEQHALLGYITGCERVPALGPQMLGLRIQHVDGPPAAAARVPWSSTCTSTLFLPVYASAAELGSKLRIALRHSTGFGLA